jgi:hypothetical protein
MENESHRNTNQYGKKRTLLSRMTSIIVTLAGTFVFVYFTVTTFVRRVFESGPATFPAVWQDWAILVAIVPVSFLIILSFLSFLKDVGLENGAFVKRKDEI